MDTKIKIRPRTKYILIFGLASFFVSYFVYMLAVGFAWLFVFGDGPTSLIQDLLSMLIIYGAPLLAWLFTIYLGYRLSLDKENISK